LEQTASNNNRTRHTEVAGLLHDREFACVTEDIVRETNAKVVSLMPLTQSHHNIHGSLERNNNSFNKPENIRY